MSYHTLRGAISFTRASCNGLSARALHCPLLSLMRSNSTGIVNIEGMISLNYNRGSLLS
jgi:hypothetical protein